MDLVPNTRSRMRLRREERKDKDQNVPELEDNVATASSSIKKLNLRRREKKSTKDNIKEVEHEKDTSCDNDNEVEGPAEQSGTKGIKRKKKHRESCVVKGDVCIVSKGTEKKRKKTTLADDKESMDIDNVEDVVDNPKGGGYSGQYRCTFEPIVTIASEIREKLAKSNAKDCAIPTQPFENLLHAILNFDTFDKSEYPKPQSLIRSIVKAYSVEDDAFQIGSTMVKLTDADIALMFGMPLTGKVVNVLSKDSIKSGLFDKYFADQGSITKGSIMIRARELIKRKEFMDTGMTQILVLLLACTLFFPNSLMNIGKSFLKHIDSIAELSEISWPKVIREDMMKKIVKYKDCPEKMPCCVYILMCWLCEHTELLERVPGRDNMPRIFRWNYKTLVEKVEKIPLSTINDDKVIQEIIDMSDDEKKLLTYTPKKGSVSLGSLLRQVAYLKEVVERQKQQINDLNSNNETLKQKNASLESLGQYLQAQVDELISSKDVEGNSCKSPENNNAGCGFENAKKLSGEDKKDANKKKVGKKTKTPSSLTKGIKQRGRRGHVLDEDYVWELPDNKVGKKGKKKYDHIEDVDKRADLENAEDLRLNDVRKSVVWKLLNNGEKSLLRAFFDEASKRTYAWEDKEKKLFIEGEVLEAIMFGDQLDERVIDWYSEWLQEKEGTNPSSIYFSANVWVAYNSGWNKTLERILDNRLNEITENTKCLYFPINTLKNKQPYHWTLLILDVKKGVWTHLNSMEQKGKKKDICRHDAERLMEHVSTVYYEAIKNKSGIRGHLSCNLDTGVCQQQPEDSVDCALYTCLNMELDPTDDDVRQCAAFAKRIPKLRAEIAVQILADNYRSWKKET